MKKKQLPTWVSAPLVAGAIGLLLWWEHRRPLRREVEAKPRRVARNLGVAAVGAVSLQFAERPVARPLAALVERRKWGLLPKLNLPAWLEVPLAVILGEVTLPQMLKLPFGHERPAWQLPGDGQPGREPSLTSPDHLLA
jgi:hypothetical protein